MFVSTAATAVTSLVHVVGPMLGPLGRDQCLVSPAGRVTVTQDGATVLQAVRVEHPVARLVTGAATRLDAATGDGTTRFVLLVHAALASVAAWQSYKAGQNDEQRSSHIDRGGQHLDVIHEWTAPPVSASHGTSDMALRSSVHGMARVLRAARALSDLRHRVLPSLMDAVPRVCTGPCCEAVSKRARERERKCVCVCVCVCVCM
jgi:hypothetical protein